ncbi:MAG: hypothetical protein GTN89_10070 [Acidobacteria bacterium]|nr:hypothetical protein [Acidobacteriota bacterium]NIM61229.1 hypothetical protein [Acidobacteriota bacterium]NIO59607.1 hypothetical protein [Acidobacteriota bacterium]NIQ30700.1 hypothetical protein [Acidobacteriota bacterium]NIQ85673.1 hypothetical protein [Acidobacteriota bacterium]
MLEAPPKVVSIVPPKKKAVRAELRVLDAYVSQISLWSSMPMKSDAIQFDDVEVPVSPWVARVLQRFCNSEITVGELEDLVARSVAVTAKCRTDLLARTDDTEDLNLVYTHQAEMMLAAAVGMVVVRELQDMCNARLKDGLNEEVRELNRLAHDTRNAVQDVRNSLDEAEKERVAHLASSLLLQDEQQPSAEDQPVQQPDSTEELPIRADRQRRHIKLASAGRRAVTLARQAREHSREFYGFALRAIAAVALLAAVIYGVTYEKAPVEEVEPLATVMLGLSGVEQVRDRNPRIVLTVADGFWNASSERRRQGWLKDLSLLAERYDYSGLEVQSERGKTLAKWAKGQGVEFTEGS